LAVVGILETKETIGRDASTSRRAHDAGLEPDMLFEHWDKGGYVDHLPQGRAAGGVWTAYP
jgi:hypothetical protein